MAAPASTVELLDLVRKSGIIPADALGRQVGDAPDLPHDPTQSAAVLVRRGLLTPFQANLLLAGRHRGFRLGPYIIREQLGQGGMGAVYLAEHETLGRRVAVKVLAPAERTNPVAVGRFLREALAAAALDHPNIVRIFDVSRHGDVHFLAMEYVDGRTLDRVVDGGPMACGRAVELVLQAAAGLQHAYEKGFVHRDIKPANLILARDGTLKILDMGLVRSFEPSDQLTAAFDKGAVVGTADTISPEQAVNSPDLDIRADIYSLGATFFTLITGTPAFVGNTSQKLLQHQMKEPPAVSDLDRTIPPGLAAVVGKMLRKKPADRYQTPARVIEALGPWLSATPRVVATLSRANLLQTPAMRTVLAGVMTASTRRRPQLPPVEVPAFRPARSKLPRYLGAGVSGLLLLTGAVAGTVFLLSGPPPPPPPPPRPPVAATQPAPPPPKGGRTGWPF